MSDRYGSARSPQPAKGHTCERRKAIERGWQPTDQDSCPGCSIERDEGWAQLLDSIRRELFGYDTHRE